MMKINYIIRNGMAIEHLLYKRKSFLKFETVVYSYIYKKCYKRMEYLFTSKKLKLEFI